MNTTKSAIAIFLACGFLCLEGGTAGIAVIAIACLISIIIETKGSMEAVVYDEYRKDKETYFTQGGYSGTLVNMFRSQGDYQAEVEYMIGFSKEYVGDLIKEGFYSLPKFEKENGNVTCETVPFKSNMETNLKTNMNMETKKEKCIVQTVSLDILTSFNALDCCADPKKLDQLKQAQREMKENAKQEARKQMEIGKEWAELCEEELNIK